MVYVESNGHVLDDDTCPVFLFITQCVFHATFRVDKIIWKYRKTANIIETRKLCYRKDDRAMRAILVDREPLRRYGHSKLS